MLYQFYQATPLFGHKQLAPAPVQHFCTWWFILPTGSSLDHPSCKWTLATEKKMVTVINYSTMETPIITYQMGWFIPPIFCDFGFTLWFIISKCDDQWSLLLSMFHLFPILRVYLFTYFHLFSSSINHQWNLFLYKCVSPCFTYSHSYDDEPPTVSFWALLRLRHAWRLSPWSEARASFSSDSDFRSDLGGRSPSKNCTFFTIKIWAFTIKLWAFTIKIWVFRRMG